MRFLILIILVVLCACEGPMNTGCKQPDIFDGKNAEQIREITNACVRSDELGRQRNKLPSISEQISEGARLSQMTPAQFMETEAGKNLIQSAYWRPYFKNGIGIFLILIVWVVTFKLIRMLVRTPVKVEIRPFLWGLWQRKVVVEWRGHEPEYWAVVLIVVAALGYMTGVYFAVMQ